MKKSLKIQGLSLKAGTEFTIGDSSEIHMFVGCKMDSANNLIELYAPSNRNSFITAHKAETLVGLKIV